MKTRGFNATAECVTCNGLMVGAGIQNGRQMWDHNDPTAYRQPKVHTAFPKVGTVKGAEGKVSAWSKVQEMDAEDLVEALRSCDDEAHADALLKLIDSDQLEELRLLSKLPNGTIRKVKAALIYRYVTTRSTYKALGDWAKVN